MRSRAVLSAIALVGIAVNLAATWMLAHGVPLVDTSRMLGHASTLITEQVYAHLMAEALRPAANTLSRLVDWHY